MYHIHLYLSLRRVEHAHAFNYDTFDSHAYVLLWNIGNLAWYMWTIYGAIYFDLTKMKGNTFYVMWGKQSCAYSL